MSLVENLIALREIYHSQLEEVERDRVRARDQLVHVDALLVDCLTSDRHFVASLIELRNQYQGLQAECDRKASHAREQLIHVNALLAERLVLQHNELVSVVSPGSEDKNHLVSSNVPRQIEAGTPEEPDSIAQTEVANQEAEQEKVEAEPVSLTPEEIEHEANTYGEVTNNGSSRTGAAVEIALESEPEVMSVTNKPSTTLRTPLLPQYQRLTKFQAVEHLLEEKAGSILHVDWIVRAIHGELSEDLHQGEKGRMSQTLSDGVKQKLWDKVPGEVGCYTHDLKLVDPELVKKASKKR